MLTSLGLVVALALSPAPDGASAQSTYTVTSAGTAADDTPGDGVCDTDDSQGDGPCTLRAAVQEANSDGADDTIAFDIPTSGSIATISATGEFTITEPVTIDGTTAPDYPSSVGGPVIELDGGSLSTTTTDGLQIEASGVTIRGLAINRFPDEGIDVFSSGDAVVIEDCFVGLSASDGESAAANLTNPDGADDAGVDLGGDIFTLRSTVISHHPGDGLLIRGSAGSGVFAIAEVTSTVIGLDHDGDAAAGNSGAGVRFTGGSEQVSFGNFGGNTISANDGTGVVVNGFSHSLRKNDIGTDASGATTTGTAGDALGNGLEGIRVNASDTRVKNNVVSGNADFGIEIGTDGPTDTTEVIDNTIGLNAANDAPLGNGLGGLNVNEGSGTVIDGNVIGGNEGRGIQVQAVHFDVNRRTAITGNYVGTNSNGADLGNVLTGINISADPSMSQRQIEIFDGNVIGHNGNSTFSANGIRLQGKFVDISGNYIGTNASGADLGNTGSGIEAESATFASIGTGTTRIDAASTAPAPNVIGFNDEHGIEIVNTGLHDLFGNYIGTNRNGADLGNGQAGIRIYAESGFRAENIEIGYDESESIPDAPSPSNGGSGNVISQNGTVGVRMAGPGTPANNSVRGNRIYGNASGGLSLDGTDGNDDGDGDGGPNYGQNYPVVEDVRNCDDASSPTTVDVDYRVRSDDGGGDASTYPITVDFYVADSRTSGQGKTHIASRTYDPSTPGAGATASLSTSAATCDDFFVATATDDRGNTSSFFSPTQQLPVELASIEGTRIQADGAPAVRLTWQTAAETDNAGFEVQRRRGTGGTWQPLGFVDSKAPGGTASTPRSYQFVDRSLPYAADTLSYRLKQVDLGGSSTVTEALAVARDKVAALQLRETSPNPARRQVTVRFAVPSETAGEAPVRLRLYDVLGRQVRTVRPPASAGRHQTQLSVQGLASGVYFLRLRAGDETRSTRLTVVR